MRVLVDSQGRRLVGSGGATLVAPGFFDDFARPDSDDIGGGWVDWNSVVHPNEDPLGIQDEAVGIRQPLGTGDMTEPGFISGWRGGFHRDTRLTAVRARLRTNVGPGGVGAAGALHVVTDDPRFAVSSWYNGTFGYWEIGAIGLAQPDWAYLTTAWAPVPAEDEPGVWVVEIRSDGMMVEVLHGGVRQEAAFIPPSLRASTLHGAQMEGDGVPFSVLVHDLLIEPWSGTVVDYATPSILVGATATEASATTVDVPLPVGAAGDSLTVHVGHVDGACSAAGWQAIQAGANGALVTTLRRLADGSEGSSVVVAKSGAAGPLAAVAARHAPANQWRVPDASGASGTSTAPAADVTLLGRHRRFLWSCFAAATVTEPDSYSRRATATVDGRQLVLADWTPPEFEFLGHTGRDMGAQQGSLDASVPWACQVTQVYPDPAA
jgi:hypothetical protein